MTTPPLSPAAQAVHSAAENAQNNYWERIDYGPESDQTEAGVIAAAALRAAAAHVIEEIEPVEELIRIANELSPHD